MTIVLLSHGSRHPRAAEGIEALRDALAARVEQDVAAAYLDLQEPDLATVVARTKGPHTVVPLLFTNAFHMKVDVPNLLRELGLPDDDLRLAAPIGTGEDVEELLAGRLEGVAKDRPVALYAVGSSDAAANDAVRDLAARVGARSGHNVQAAFATRGGLPARTGQPGWHVLPLFVTHGLLLDKVLEGDDKRKRNKRMPNEVSSAHPPLMDHLAPLLAKRCA